MTILIMTFTNTTTNQFNQNLYLNTDHIQNCTNPTSNPKNRYSQSIFLTLQTNHHHPSTSKSQNHQPPTTFEKNPKTVNSQAHRPKPEPKAKALTPERDTTWKGPFVEKESLHNSDVALYPRQIVPT